MNRDQLAQQSAALAANLQELATRFELVHRVLVDEGQYVDEATLRTMGRIQLDAAMRISRIGNITGSAFQLLELEHVTDPAPRAPRKSCLRRLLDWRETK